MGNKTFYWDGLNGMTLHSYLKLPIGSKRLTELKGVALQQPQNNLENVEYLIIHNILWSVRVCLALHVGMTYVVLSRVKKLEDLVREPMSLERLQASKRSTD